MLTFYKINKKIIYMYENGLNHLSVLYIVILPT